MQPPEVSEGRVCIVIHQDVYGDVASSIAQYASDLGVMGYEVVTYLYSSGSAEALRVYLAQLYQEQVSLAGAVFIGDIPYIVYEMMQDWGYGEEYEDFPCDIFYMDLDGSWSDTLEYGQVHAGNGKYDTRGGDLALEIWASRLKTENLSALGTETDILNDYFTKNHSYRTGLLTPDQEALVYNDDDWWYMAVGDRDNISSIYDISQITTIDDPEETTAFDYKSNHLTANYELMSVRSHGYPGGHGFYRNSGSIFEYVYNSDYLTYDPAAVFYSLFVCSGADYTAANYLAGAVSFNQDDSGLLVWGSTKTGGMWSDSSFYSALENGEVLGEAFRQWFNLVQNLYPSYTPRWWYGMVLIGDGALMRSVGLPPVVESAFFDECISELGQAELSITALDPASGDLTHTWTPLDGGAIIGSGTSVEFDPPDTGPHPCPYRVEVTVTSSVSGLSTTDTIEIYVKLAGDVNGDSFVNVVDKVLVRNSFGQSGPPGWIDADVNCDGNVNVVDKVLVRNQFGQTGCGCP